MNTPNELLNLDSHLDNISLGEWKKLRMLKKVRKLDCPLYDYNIFKRLLKVRVKETAIEFELSINESLGIMTGFIDEPCFTRAQKVGLRIN